MLHIWLPTQHGKLYVWLEKEENWQSYENWQAIADTFSIKSVCLYFPSQHVLKVESDLPSAQLKQLGETGKQYLFEDISLASVEQLTIRQLEKSGHQFLYACTKNDIEQWQNSAMLAGVDIHLMLPDFLLLPVEDNKVVLYNDSQTTLLRQSEPSGMSVNFLPLVLEQLQIQEEIIVLTGLDDLNSDLFVVLDDMGVLYSSSNQTVKPVEQPHRHPLNFMVRRSKSSVSPYLQTTVMIAAIALVLQITADTISGYQYRKVEQATTSAISKQYRSWFPEGRFSKKTNLQRQVEPMLKSSSSNETSGLSTLSKISPLIKQSSIVASSFVIDDKKLKLQLVANNRGELDKFLSKLQSQGISAQLGAINNKEKSDSDKKVVIGEIVVEHVDS